MFSFGYPQIILAVYLFLIITGAPVLRYAMIRRGAVGFVPWGEFWGTWSADFTWKLVLVGILFWGGFWG